MTSSIDLEPLGEKIRAAYEDLDHQLGWNFLNGPARTLAHETRLAFVGLNPGGDRYYPPKTSVETGSAYRRERWGKGNTLNPLQLQVRRLFDELAGKLGGDGAQLMDDTLAWNFCPFRSPSWDKLPNPKESLAFSAELASSVFAVCEPLAILCLGAEVDRQIGAVLEKRGLQRIEAQKPLAGWGKVTYGLTRYAAGDRAVLVVRLPHLSRFGIFGRPASAAAVDQLTDAVAHAVSYGERGGAAR